jgi:putative endonuclease
MTSTAQRRIAVGQYGEDVAAQSLRADGLVVLARNWRCSIGELDLVCRDGNELVAVEVKTRSGDLYGSPLEAVTPRKAARLRRLLAQWLSEHEISPSGLRVDVVSVRVPARGAAQVEHVRGVA